MDNKKFLKLQDIEAYRISFQLSNYVWEMVKGWNRIMQNTVGEQFIRAADSVSANLAEGFGRYNKKDKIRFYRISYASMMECIDWNEKAKTRNLIAEDQYAYVFAELEKLPKSINSLIKFTNDKLAF